MVERYVIYCKMICLLMLRWFGKVGALIIRVTVEVVLRRRSRNVRSGRSRKESESGNTTIVEIDGRGVVVGPSGTTEEQKKSEKQADKSKKMEG